MGDLRTLIKEYQEKYPGGTLRENEPLSAHTSFRIGGRASVMFFPRTAEEVRFLGEECRRIGIRTLFMGNGTNLLVADTLPEMAVIKLGELNGLSESGGTMSLGAGVLLSKAASFALERGLTGLEFAAGIPGTAGGAVYMNAGAYGGEMKDIVSRVTVLDDGFNLRTYEKDECDFSYRHSRFNDDGSIIISAEISLIPGEREAIRARMDDLSLRRRTKQPLNFPSAGSTFKRPENGFAAAMIEEAGLKGYTVGGAQVSEKHAGFVVNKGGATFSDVYAVMEHVRETVLAKTGVELSPEVKIIR